MDNGWLMQMFAQCAYADRLREAEEARRWASHPVPRISLAKVGALAVVAMGVLVAVWQLV